MPLIRTKLLPLIAVILVLTYYWYSPSRSPLSTMGSSQPIRLAILECDTPQPNANEKFGGYRGIFTILLRAAAEGLSPTQPLEQILSIQGYDVVEKPDNYPPLEEVDALLLTGSKHTAADDIEWINKLTEYTKKAIEGGRVKVIGVCFGHQIIGRALGAKLGRSDKGWEIAVTEVNLTSAGKEVFSLDKIRIQQMHKDIVFNYPTGSKPIGSNDICTNQGMYAPGRYITVQGHPEFTEDIISEVLTNRNKQGVFSDDVYKEAMTRAAIPHDGVAIAKGFLKFLREG